MKKLFRGWKKQWRRRLGITLASLAGLLLILRLHAPLLLPLVIDRVAGIYGFDCAYDSLSLSILGGTAEIWNVRLTPRGGNQTVLQADYAQGDISLLNLLRGRLVIYRVAADGVQINIERAADGHLPILATLPLAPRTANSGPTGASATAENFTPPLRIDELRLTHVKAKFDDHHVVPNFEARLALDVSLSDFGMPGRPTQFEMDFSSDQMLDSLQVAGQGTSDGKTISAEINVRMRGLHLKPAAEYLAAASLRPTADDISASMAGFVQLSAASNPVDGLQAQLTLNNPRLVCDGAEAAAVDQLTMDAQGLTAGEARLGTVHLSGVRCNVERGADGLLGAAGVEYAPTALSVPSSVAMPSFKLTLGHLAVDSFHTAFTDSLFSPPVQLAMDGSLSANNLIPDTQQPNLPIDLTAEMTSPGMVRSATMQIHATPLGDKRSFALTAGADGITLEAIAPYLAQAGLTSEWKDGSLRAALTGSASRGPDGKLSVSAGLSNFSLKDPNDLLTLTDASLSGARFDARTATIEADSIDVSGPAVSMRRDSQGDLHALGLRLDPAAAMAKLKSGGMADIVAHLTAAKDSRAASLVPNVEIGHFVWKGIALNLTDEAVQPPASVAVKDAGLEVENFYFPPPHDTSAPHQGVIHAWINAPGIAPDLKLDGTLKTAPGQFSAETDLSGSGLNGTALSPYLSPLGVTPILSNGSLKLHTDFEIATGAGDSLFSLTASDGELADGSRTLIALPSASIESLRAGGDGISVDSVKMDSPRLAIARRPDGSLEIAGLLINPLGMDLSATAGAAPIPKLTIGQLAIQNAAVDWTDHAVGPEVDASANANVQMSGFAYATAAAPAKVHVTASVAGIMDSLIADGTVAASPGAQSANLQLDVQGLHGEAAAYLPAGVRSNLHNGEFHAGLALNSADNPAGGRSVDLTASNAALSDAGDSQPLLGFSSLHAKASRFDPAGKIIAMDDLTLSGLQGQIHAASDGLGVGGLEMTALPRSVTALPDTRPAAAGAEPAGNSDDLLKEVAAERDRLPLVSLKTLDLDCDRISLTTDVLHGGAPLLVSDLHIVNSGDLIWLGRDVESNPPTNLTLTGKLHAGGDKPGPVVDDFKIDAHLTPFLRQKTLSADFLLTGIHGGGVAALAPGLLHGSDATGLTSGTASGSLSLALRLQNVRQTDLNFAYGGKMDVSLKDFKFRASPTGDVLAGVGEVHTDNIGIGPDFANLDIGDLSVENVTGQASRQRDGIHVLGVTIAEPKSFVDSGETAQLAAQVQPPVSPPSASLPVSVGDLLISGMNFQIEDDTITPPLVAPIDGLDVEVRGLSNQPASQDKPIHFTALVDAGKVQLPHAANSRQLFSQVAASGEVSLSPNLKGWAKASVSGFELTSLAGFAEAHHVSLGGGTFDGDADLRFPGDGSVDTSTRLVLTDLSLSEPSNGDLTHALNLPAPLDVVIAAMQDQDGSITIPLNVDIHNGQLDEGSVLAAGSGALASVVATSVASSPLKLANLAGFNSPQAEHEPPIVMTFPGGYPGLSASEVAALAPLIRRLQEDRSLEVTVKHDLGSDDIALAESRMNPDKDDTLDLASDLNQRRAALLAARRTAASDVRALLASTATVQAEAAVERLRSIDQQLADIDTAADKLYDLLRPGADRQATRRTRQACLDIAEARLKAIKELLIGSGKKKLDADRIHLTNAQFTANPAGAAGTVTIVVVHTK